MMKLIYADTGNPIEAGDIAHFAAEPLEGQPWMGGTRISEYELSAAIGNTKYTYYESRLSAIAALDELLEAHNETQ